MAWPDDLAVIEISALEALAEACDYSLSAHVPVEATTRRTKTHLRGDIKKGLKKIIKRGLCQMHPTGGNMTYELTLEGLTLASQIFDR